MSTGLIYMDWFGVTTEILTTCVSSLIKSGDSVVFFTLTATFLSFIVDTEWEDSRLAVSVKFSSGVTVTVVLHSDGWSTKAVIVFVVLGGFVRISSVRTDWGFALFSVVELLTCLVKCGKFMRPSVVSMTTLLCLKKCQPSIGPLKFFNTTKCSAKVSSPISDLSVVVGNGFSDWPFATWFRKSGESWILKIIYGACCFILPNLTWVVALTLAFEFTRASIVRPLSKSRAYTALFSAFQQYGWGEWEIPFIGTFVSHQSFFDVGSCYCEKGNKFISNKCSQYVLMRFLIVGRTTIGAVEVLY